jgi:hypothetical protein
MNMNEPPSLLRNEYSGTNNWLKVKLIGTKSNRTALGAKVTVLTGDRQQSQVVLSQSSYYSHDDLRLHFGLGNQTRADRIRITWPSGQTETINNIAAGQLMTVKEGSGIIGIAKMAR